MPRIIASAQTMLATGRQEANKAQRDAQPITPSIVSIGAVAVAIIRSAPARGSANPGTLADRIPPRRRSEEHTSELQSLMRISYDVFCLKKKTPNKQITHKANTAS